MCCTYAEQNGQSLKKYIGQETDQEDQYRIGKKLRMWGWFFVCKNNRAGQKGLSGAESPVLQADDGGDL